MSKKSYYFTFLSLLLSTGLLMAQEETAVEEVLSPMPGTFYAAPTPEDRMGRETHR